MRAVHAMWREYAAGLVAPTPGTTLQAHRDRLLAAELHGALVRVRASRARPDTVGLTGIVVSNRPQTVVVVTPGDRRVQIPKPNTTLELLMGTKLVTLEYGDSPNPK